MNEIETLLYTFVIRGENTLTRAILLQSFIYTMSKESNDNYKQLEKRFNDTLEQAIKEDLIEPVMMGFRSK